MSVYHQITNLYAPQIIINNSNFHMHFKILSKHISNNFIRARAANCKYGPVDLSKNENDWEGLEEWLISK